MKIVHISDTHGHKGHSQLVIPECDVLIHSGDIGGRTNSRELTEFLIWFEQQPADVKIFCAGNHDICLDKKWVSEKSDVQEHLHSLVEHEASKNLLSNYAVHYLENEEYVYKGIKFYGSPISPSFHRKNWVFNADIGVEINKYWAKIPSDVNVLITHTPPYGIFDKIPEKYKQAKDEDIHRGCKDLLAVMRKRLFNLKLVCFGHIHDQYGVTLESVSNARRVLFSNAAVLTNDYTQLITNPLIINI
jgi:Icc-related predicted phosphoesterase